VKSKAKPSPTTRRKTPTRGRGFHLGLARSLALGAVLLVAVILGLRFLRPGGTHSFAASELNGRGWNVILISLDTARPDAYAATAGPSAPVPSPGLDRLLGGGIRMSQMISPVPITLPGHATMLTGLDPHRHGVRENTEYALSPGAETLAERFRAAGYRTAAFVSSFVMDARFGLAQGFELYEDRLSGPEAGLRLGNVELPGGVTTARAQRWLETQAKQDGTAPFFLFLHYYDPHAPYRPPAPFAQDFAQQPYHGELAYLDRCVGQLLDTLESTGLARNTLLWVVSDHGESLGEHGESTHSLFIYDATLRVVSLLRTPPNDGRYVAGAPRVDLAAQTGLVDLFPTLSELCGVPAEGGALDGRSLVPAFRGEALPPRALYCETLSPRVSYHWAALRGVRTEEWKYVRAPIPELYDLANDPKELRNLAAARPTEVERLSAELDRFLAIDGSAEAARTPSREELEQLRSLGYLSGAEGASEGDDLKLPDPKRMVAFFNGQYQSAKNLLYAGRFPEAAAAFREALSIDPLNNSTHLYLAAALRQAGQLDEAGRAYRRALEIEAASPRAWYGWGQTLLLADRADSAAWALHAAITLLPQAPEQWQALGEAEWVRGRPLEALSAFDSSLAKGSEDPKLRGLIGRLYLEAGQRDQALPWIRRYAAGQGLDPAAAEAQLPMPRGRPGAAAVPESAGDH